MLLEPNGACVRRAAVLAAEGGMQSACSRQSPPGVRGGGGRLEKTAASRGPGLFCGAVLSPLRCLEELGPWSGCHKPVSPQSDVLKARGQR